MQFQMPVTVVGAMSFRLDNGQEINQLYVINADPENKNYRGYVPAKMNCDPAVVQALPADPSQFPMNVMLTVTNKTSGGKTVQHAQSLVRDPAAKKAG